MCKFTCTCTCVYVCGDVCLHSHARVHIHMQHLRGCNCVSMTSWNFTKSWNFFCSLARFDLVVTTYTIVRGEGPAEDDKVSGAII